MKALIFSLLIMIPVLGYSQEFPENTNRLVSDFSETLTKAEIQKLEELLFQYEQESSVQIAIVLMETLDGHPIADYSVRLFNRWKIGQEGLDNGVLILLSIEERKSWITTGYGMEASLTDALSRRITENEMIPHFKNDDYAGGLEAASLAIVQVTRGEYQGTGRSNGDRPALPWWGVLIAIFVWFWVTQGWRIGSAMRHAKRNNIGFWAAWVLLSSSRKTHSGSWSSFSGGSGGFSGGGGGFGGFGGGMSGGGGAGGSW